MFRDTSATFVPGSTALAREWYAAECFARETDLIFARHWLFVGHEFELSNCGDGLVASMGNESALLVRDGSGALRAFHNVCRHRGARLCESAGHLGAAIRCPYHAWTYALNGRLLGAPHMDEVPGFHRDNYPLRPLALASLDGLLFVSFDDAPEPFERVFALLLGKFARWNLARLRRARRLEYEVAANWKLIGENYSECYHCPGVHPGLARLTPFDAGANDLTEGSFLGGYMRLAEACGSVTASGHRCGVLLGDLDDEEQRRVYYYSIFPNLLLSVHPDYLMTHALWPQAAERTRIVCDWWFHPDSFARDGFNPDDAVGVWDEVNRQDWRVCERAQRGVASRAYRPGPLSPRESLVAAWDRRYLAAMRQAPTESSR